SVLEPSEPITRARRAGAITDLERSRVEPLQRRHLLPRRGRDADRRQGEAEIRLPSQALGRLRKAVEQPNDASILSPGMLQGERACRLTGRTLAVVDGLLDVVAVRVVLGEHLVVRGQRS